MLGRSEKNRDFYREEVLLTPKPPLYFIEEVYAPINRNDNICASGLRSKSMKSLIVLSAFFALLVFVSSCSGSRSLASKNHRTSCANAF